MSVAIRTTVSLVAFAAVSLVCSAQAQTPATIGSDSLVEAVVYTTLRPPNWDIYLFDEPGGEPRRLTDDPALDYNAVFSPDGRWIVFTSERAGRNAGKVYVFDDDSRDRRRLTDADASEVETMPALSPDGEWVVFPTDRTGGRKLWLQRVDGSEGRFLEPDRLDIPDVSMHPRFSPDGQWIVFTSDRGGFNDEWVLAWDAQAYGELWAVPVKDGPAVRLTHDKWENGPNDWGYVRLPDDR